MKKVYLLFIMIILLLTSCSLGDSDMRFIDDDQVANDTFEQILNAIQHQDETALKNLFSKKVRDEISNFDESIVALFDIFQGKELSFNATAGIGVDKEVDHGKKRKEIQSAYDIKTSEEEYHVAIKECTVDTFDSDNVGVTSVYIINAKDWKKDYVYRGDLADGKWALGINIVKE